MVVCIVNIVILGENSDNEISNLIINNISKYTPEIFMDSKYLHAHNKYKHKCPNNSILIYDIKNITESDIEPDIIIFKNTLDNKVKHMPIPDKSICIIDSVNKQAAGIMSENRAVTITCGISRKDTFSMASFSPPRMVISLQRDILTLNNTLLEARDIILNLYVKCHTYSALVTCALICLLGTPPIKDEYNI